jgi:hypothetical protein
LTCQHKRPGRSRDSIELPDDAPERRA